MAANKIKCCPTSWADAVEISALKNEGSEKAAELARRRRQEGQAGELPHVFTGAGMPIAHIEFRTRPLPARVSAVRNARSRLAEPNKDCSIDAHITDCEKKSMTNTM